MNGEYWMIAAAAALWLAAMVHAVAALAEGRRFDRYVARCVREAPALFDAVGRFRYQPRVAIILPCCGIDEKLEHTVAALKAQRYEDFEVVFTFASADDSAYAAIGAMTAGWDRPATRRVVAGEATSRGQKVHNLLAAVAAVSADREVYVFLDSDAVPGSDWLGHLVAPLADQSVGAATGYRWYTAGRGLASQLRSAWNAATVTLLADGRSNFCWGGGTAIRRDVFDRCGVRAAWDSAVSDDYALSKAVRAAGLHIRFVPYALAPSSDATTLPGFWSFALRQIILTRVYAPHVWRAGLLLCLNLVVGGTAAAVLFFAALLGWIGATGVTWPAFAAWMALLAAIIGRAAYRQRAVRRVLRPPDATWRDAWADLSAVTFSGLMFLALMIASMRTRRIVWRGIEYDMVSPRCTRILNRAGLPANQKSPNAGLQ